MMWVKQRWLPLTVLVVAVVALVVSFVWVSTWTADRDIGYGGFMGPTSSDLGPVTDLDAAHDAAQEFGDRWNLDVGEVMQFDNNFYAVLVDDEGNPVTEVLIDPSTGTTHLEWGPAMMWNNAFGMHRGGMGMHRFGYDDGIDKADRSCDLAAEEAVEVADEWLRDKGIDETSREPLQFPGYYTLHTVQDEKIVGMLSVRCRSSDVWYHTWHGDFVGESDH